MAASMPIPKDFREKAAEYRAAKQMLDKRFELRETLGE
jgi:hypothetical protein